MALEDDIRILSRVSLLSDFSQEQLRLLAFGAEGKRFRAGTDIYEVGAEADCAYVVTAGTVELFRLVDGRQMAIATAGPGAMLGEYALISGSERHTGAVARTDVETLRLSRTLFRRILEEYPELAAKLHQRIAAELKGFLENVTRLAPKFSD